MRRAIGRLDQIVKVQAQRRPNPSRFVLHAMTVGTLVVAVFRGIANGLKFVIISVLKMGRWVWDKITLR